MQTEGRRQGESLNGKEKCLTKKKESQKLKN